MTPDPQPAIIRILRPPGGTGFVVTADGLIATCAHIVRGAQTGDTIGLAFHSKRYRRNLDGRLR